jgi:DNA primase
VQQLSRISFGRNKKDFILFQLEISLKDTVNDSVKKAALVNQIAETISRINKAEDFTKQQDYIRQCADLLKIEESGLNTLVNKFIREKVTKAENKFASEEFQTSQEVPVDLMQDDMLNLLFKDELQEKAVVKALVEFGLKEWDEEKKVADHIFEELGGRRFV